ncbi:glutaredoxin domain-containing protein [Acidobacteriota bacterium]
MLFTYPNCAQCEALKKHLHESRIEAEEYNLVVKESKLKIRDFLKVLKRDEKGGIVIPTLIIRDQDEVVAVLNNREEFQDWSQSRA